MMTEHEGKRRSAEIDEMHRRLHKECRQRESELKAEIERLRAIVDKLPKTADGVPIVCDADGFVDPPLYWFDCGTAKATFLPHEHGGIGECYSTREAALAAGDSDEA